MSIDEQIKQYIKNNLAVEVHSVTNDFMSTDGSTVTCFTVKLMLEGEPISEDSYYS